MQLRMKGLKLIMQDDNSAKNATRLMKKKKKTILRDN